LTIVTERFAGLGTAVAESLDRPELPFLVIPHPFGGLPLEDIQQRAQEVAQRLPAAIREAALQARQEAVQQTSSPDPAEPTQADKSRITIDATDTDDVSHALYGLGMTDGLPVIAPTPERVAKALEYAGRDPASTIGPVPPEWRILELEAVAANAVMAGCAPEAFPVVLQAVEAMMSDPAFNLYGMQTTTHPIGPMVMVCGPVADELQVWGGIGCLGPGWRSNATIGRAVRFVLTNGGGAHPGGMDKATMGQPGKYSFCFSENEAESPWSPYRLDYGFKETDSTITVVGAEAPLNINDHGSTTAEGLLRTIAGTMSTTGNNNLYWLGETFLIIGPEHAQSLAREGLSKEDVKAELHERARVPVDKMSTEQFAHLQSWIHESEVDTYVDANGSVALVREPNDIKIVVAGGPGKHSMWVPTWFRSVTKGIVDELDRPVQSVRQLRRGEEHASEEIEVEVRA
jgi:hypothetical protein